MTHQELTQYQVFITYIEKILYFIYLIIYRFSVILIVWLQGKGPYTNDVIVSDGILLHNLDFKNKINFKADLS
jgi:hypothetical protein